MNTHILNTKDLKISVSKLKAGDRVLLSGTVYTARDAAHKRLTELLANNQPLPIEIDGATIYYAGPTQTPDTLSIGSCGPTTSIRMDRFSPALLDLGMVAMIGKGKRNDIVVDSIIKNNAIYLCAIGGAGALACSCIKSCEVVAFEDLGCESIKKLEFSDFPLFVGIDSDGGQIFTER